MKILRKITAYTVCFLTVLILVTWVCSPVYATVTPHITISVDPGGAPSISVPHAAATKPGTYFLGRGKLIAQGIFGLCTIASLCGFIYHVVHLCTAGGNDMARERAMRGLFFSILTLALLGGFAMVVSLFWGLFV